MAGTSFGEALRRLRRETGHSLADLADALGCSIAFISEMERGHRNPPPIRGIKTLLAAMGQEHRLSEFLTLAAKSRQLIQFNIKDKSDDVISMLAALQRRCDEGELEDEIMQEIRRLRERLEGGAS